MSENKEPKQNQLNIDVPEEVAGGVYANFVIIGHSQTEFVVDFVQMLPAIAKPKVKSRVIMAPIHAKRMMMAMQENIQRYEASFGTISVPQNGGQPPFPPQGFGGPAGIA